MQTRLEGISLGECLVELETTAIKLQMVTELLQRTVIHGENGDYEVEKPCVEIAADYASILTEQIRELQQIMPGKALDIDVERSKTIAAG